MREAFKEEWIKTTRKSLLNIQEDILPGVIGGIPFIEDTQLIEVVKELQPSKILDFGCGLCRNTIKLQEIAETHGYDSFEMVSKAIRNVKINKEITLHSYWEHVKTIKYDVVVCSLVLEHIDQHYLDEILQSIAKMTKQLVVVGKTTLDNGESLSHTVEKYFDLKNAISNIKVYHSQFTHLNTPV